MYLYLHKIVTVFYDKVMLWYAESKLWQTKLQMGSGGLVFGF
jgi:hypothetical protein